MKTAAIILAAGASSRLGEPKQRIKLNGETLVQRAVRIATEASCEPVVVVLGANAELVREDTDGTSAVIVENPDWAQGIASSIRAGVRAAIDSHCDGVLLIACDQPAASAAHLRELMAASSDAVASAYAGRRGIPAYFSARHFAALLALTGDTGARDLLREATAIPLQGGELDVDTPQDLQRAREIFGS